MSIRTRETNGLNIEQSRINPVASILETKYNFAPLPPAEISRNALLAMQGLGFSEENIFELRKMVAKYRYDGVEQRLNELIKEPIIFTDFEFIIPHFYRILDDFTGPCGYLAYKFLSNILQSNLLNSINSELKDGSFLSLKATNGNSKNNFNISTTNHWWINMKCIKSDGSDIDFCIDPSYQKICLLAESGYTPNQKYDLHRLTMPSSASFMPANIIFGEINSSFSMTIGISACRQYAINILFAFNRDKNSEIVPIINLLPKYGETTKIFFMDDELKENGNPISLDKEQSQEIVACLRILNKAKFIKADTSNLSLI